MEKACESLDRERLHYQLSLVKLVDKVDKLLQELDKVKVGLLPGPALNAVRSLRTESFLAHRTLGTYYELLGE
jgi:hypothetical protein